MHLTEKENQKLQVWSKIMPCKESFTWAIVSLFDNSIGAASVGPAFTSSPLAPSEITMMGKILLEMEQIHAGFQVLMLMMQVYVFQLHCLISVATRIIYFLLLQ